MDSRDDVTSTTSDSRVKPRLGFFKVVQSILAGALGVQSSKRREEDFESASPWAFIVGGLIFGGLFIGGLIILVNVVLTST